MTDYIKIGGKAYDVIVESVEETFNNLYGEDTGRTLGEGAPMFLQPLGTFFGHKIVFRRKAGSEQEYDELYNFFAKPRSMGFMVDLVHAQTSINYSAYASNGGRTLQRIDEKTGNVYWDSMTINFVPIEAYHKPSEIY